MRADSCLLLLLLLVLFAAAAVAAVAAAGGSVGTWCCCLVFVLLLVVLQGAPNLTPFAHTHSRRFFSNENKLRVSPWKCPAFRFRRLFFLLETRLVRLFAFLWAFLRFTRCASDLVACRTHS